jgi:hypothetical protein
MAFQTPQHELSDYLKWTTSGKIQLPDFQRSYKWEDERIRQLLVTVLRGHPMGAVMMLATGNDQVRFKPRAVEGVTLTDGVEADWLLLDGQQRLTSLTQALTGDGVVNTKDARGQKLQRKYYLDMNLALQGDDRMDEAVRSIPADGKIRSNFGKQIDFDISSEDKEIAARHFPLRLLYDPLGAATWLTKLPDVATTMPVFMAQVIQPTNTYDIPAIQLDKTTSKSAVATVFEKVNTGGLPLNVFELLTSVFAGDADYYGEHGEDFRLNDDWHQTQEQWKSQPVLETVVSTDFLQAVTMLTTLKQNRAHTGDRPPAVSAKREDVLKLTLKDYIEWRDALRDGFVWAATFLADRHVFKAKEVPYAKQLVPLAAIKVVLGSDADLIGVKERIIRWFWCGILGELYGSANETRFARDIESVPGWAKDPAAPLPRTIADASFVESRLLSLSSRRAAAYKGIAALVLAQGARDWMEDKALDKVQYVDLAVDIHHIFPQKWCETAGIDWSRCDSIVNKTAIGAHTNRAIGGVAPSEYLGKIEKRAQVTGSKLDDLVAGHLIDAKLLRGDDFDEFFDARREALCQMIEKAMGKEVQRDLSAGEATEDASAFEAEDLIEGEDYFDGAE